MPCRSPARPTSHHSTGRGACVDRGFITERFEANKGDLLIWHADLLHGGAKIENPSRTRKSLVTHFMPLGVMPTFYDSSDVSARELPSDERDELFAQITAAAPGFAEYQAKTTRVIPVFELQPAS